MTHTAGAFIGPLTLETLSRRRVMLDPLELLPDRRIGHIVAADAADAVLVAPATARWLAAMANGLSDDVVTATCLATTRARGRRARPWMATCMPIPPRAPTCRRSQASAIASWSRRSGPWHPAASARAGWRSCPRSCDAVIAAIGTVRCAPRTARLWPPVVEPAHAARTWRAGTWS